MADLNRILRRLVLKTESELTELQMSAADARHEVIMADHAVAEKTLELQQVTEALKLLEGEIK